MWCLLLVLFSDCLASPEELLIEEESIENTDWGNTQRVYLDGFTWSDAQAMEPFLSRDGRYLFWNSRNVGVNTTLFYGYYDGDGYVKYADRLTGEANGRVPHLDAVPSMDLKNNFYWVSTRNYPQDIQNLQQGKFESFTGGVPRASPVAGNFYIGPDYVHNVTWIVMDQEINAKGNVLFYVNAQFSIPPKANPEFSNISLAVMGRDGIFREHNDSVRIMSNVNQHLGSEYLRYGPSSWGPNEDELYLTIRAGKRGSALYVSKKDVHSGVYGVPQEIQLQSRSFIEPEAPTISLDGNTMMYCRLDCVSKEGCRYYRIYQMTRVNNTKPALKRI